MEVRCCTKCNSDCNLLNRWAFFRRPFKRSLETLPIKFEVSARYMILSEPTSISFKLFISPLLHCKYYQGNIFTQTSFQIGFSRYSFFSLPRMYFERLNRVSNIFRSCLKAENLRFFSMMNFDLIWSPNYDMVWSFNEHLKF